MRSFWRNFRCLVEQMIVRWRISETGCVLDKVRTGKEVYICNIYIAIIGMIVLLVFLYEFFSKSRPSCRGTKMASASSQA
jgi:hypothetical protein